MYSDKNQILFGSFYGPLNINVVAYVIYFFELTNLFYTFTQPLYATPSRLMKRNPFS